ncbi:MAG: Mur ligase domain-containing protein, partial [Candidatus Puniceispirillum sp.]
MTAPLWTLADARAECNGHLMPTDSIADIHDIKIDSRECGDGDLFVALAGEAQDGHQFLSQAKSNRAAAALVSKPDSDLALPQIVVDDSLAGLTRLASAGRRRFTGKMIGITGSVGKTGSKDMLAQA